MSGSRRLATLSRQKVDSSTKKKEKDIPSVPGALQFLKANKQTLAPHSSADGDSVPSNLSSQTTKASHIPSIPAAAFLKYQEDSLVDPTMDLAIGFKYKTTDDKIVCVTGKLPPSKAYLTLHTSFLSQFATYLCDENKQWLANMKSKCEIKPNMPLEEILNRMNQYAVTAYQLKLSEQNLPRIQDQLDKEATELMEMNMRDTMDGPLVLSKDSSSHVELDDLELEMLSKQEEDAEMMKCLALSAAEDRLKKSVKLAPLDVKLGEDEPVFKLRSTKSISKFFKSPTSDANDTDIPQRYQQVPVPTPRRVHVSDLPGRYDAEEYNTARAAFMTHRVYDLKSDNSASKDFISRYFGIMPRSRNGLWQSPTYTGVVFHAPGEDLSLQTVFIPSYEDGVMSLMADSTVVARFRIFDIADLIPEHASSLKEDGTRDSALERLLASNTVPCFTANALRWMMDDGRTDSIINKLSIRACIGFDPFYTRSTHDGLTEAAILMDDKWTLKSKQRMAARVAKLCAPSPAATLFHMSLKGRWEKVQSEFDRSGYVLGVLAMYLSQEQTQACSSIAVEKLNVEASQRETAAALQRANDQTHRDLESAVSSVKTLKEAIRRQATAQVDLEDEVARWKGVLMTYIDKHECLNTNKSEAELMITSGYPRSNVRNVMQARAALKQEVISKYKDMGADEALEMASCEQMKLRDQIDQLTAERTALEDDLARVIHELELSREERTRLENDYLALEHSLCMSAAKTHQIAHSTKLEHKDGDQWQTDALDIDPLPAPCETAAAVDLNEFCSDEW
ncbi:muNS [Reptilian orthoreovirus]|uniref:MuNS n=1 Tax=Reptilian orthoreovirus TaxID=226613 RepID=W8PCD1_9REOV|nr:muNS [Reptilian orthoreovirus]AHL26966.1 muNS [Reptilian orthoreovirus]